MNAPIETKYEASMRKIAKMVDVALNPVTGEKKVAFVLLIAEFGKIDGGRVNYISNGPRDDHITMMKEMIARHEGRYIEPAEGNVQ